MKSLFVCLIANEQNTTAYFLPRFKIFHGDVSCRDSFLPAHDEGQLAARSESFTFKARALQREKALLRTGPLKEDMRVFAIVTLQSTQVPVEGGSQS